MTTTAATTVETSTTTATTVETSTACDASVAYLPEAFRGHLVVAEAAATAWVDTAAVATVDESSAVEVVGRVEAVAVGFQKSPSPGSHVPVRSASPIPAGVEACTGVFFG